MNATAPADSSAGYLSPQDVSRGYGFDQGTIYNWITAGVRVGGTLIRLHAIRVGRSWRIPLASWEAFLGACNGGQGDSAAHARPGRCRRGRGGGASDPDREALHRKLGVGPGE